MTIPQQHTSEKKIVVLVGPGFDEMEMIKYLLDLRNTGAAVCLVGYSAGLVTGAHGLTVRPDYSLADLDEGKAVRIMLMPGGSSSVSTLLADPRIHDLFEAIRAGDGRVAITTGAKRVFLRTGFQALLSKSHFVTPRNGNGDSFMQEIINWIEKA